MECSGKIQVAFVNGTHVIKLSGDIRLNLCTGLEKYIDETLAVPNFTNVWSTCQKQRPLIALHWAS